MRLLQLCRVTLMPFRTVVTNSSFTLAPNHFLGFLKLQSYGGVTSVRVHKTKAAANLKVFHLITSGEEQLPWNMAAIAHVLSPPAQYSRYSFVTLRRTLRLSFRTTFNRARKYIAMATVVLGPPALALHGLDLLPNHGTWERIMNLLGNSEKTIYDSYVLLFAAYYCIRTCIPVIQPGPVMRVMVRNNNCFTSVLILHALVGAAASYSESSGYSTTEWILSFFKMTALVAIPGVYALHPDPQPLRGVLICSTFIVEAFMRQFWSQTHTFKRYSTAHGSGLVGIPGHRP